MKLHPAYAAGRPLFTAYGEGYVEINHERHESSIIVLPETLIPWTASRPESLTEADMAPLRALGVPVILLGTGARFRLLPPALLAPFSALNIGLEIMDLPAACRTYNLLAAEGRAVAAALVFDPK